MQGQRFGAQGRTEGHPRRTHERGPIPVEPADLQCIPWALDIDHKSGIVIDLLGTMYKLGAHRTDQNPTGAHRKIRGGGPRHFTAYH